MSSGSISDGNKDAVTAGPVSRILSARLWRRAGRSFLWAAHYCAALATYPEVVRAESARGRRSASPSLFGLAPCGVCPARSITGAAVRSYRTFSPLPRAVARAWAVCFLWHFPSAFLPASPSRAEDPLWGDPGEKCRPEVIRHTALWSSDFPLQGHPIAG